MRTPRRTFISPRFTLSLIGALMLALAPALFAPPRAQPPVASALVLEIDGAIGPATTEYVANGLAAGEARGAPLVILRMDTPGGLDAATREIISKILASPVPVAVYVAPAGARAASAGAYILYASHLAAMAPGTHVGAATPVQIGGSTPLPGGDDGDKSEATKAEPRDAMTAKMVNDAAAYIASLAGLRGRNAEWAERAVREAATLTSEQALKEGVIELRPADLNQLLAQANGRKVRLADREITLKLSGVQAQPFPPGWRILLLQVITNPNIAYILLLVGVYGIIFEFMSPGGVGPGVIGAIALLVGLFALNLLPVNYAGLALLALGIALMTVEAATPSIGVLGVGGAVAFTLGSLFLFKGPLPEFRLSPGIVIAATGLSLVYFTLAISAVARTRRIAAVIGPAALRRETGQILSWNGDRGTVQAHGEVWQARAQAPLRAGERVRLVDREGLVLTVEPTSDADAKPP